MFRAQRPGNRKRLFLLTIASGNGSEQWTQPTQKWNTVIWQLNITVISRKSSRSYNNKLVVQKGCETFGIQASKTNIMMLGMFLSSSMRAAIHLHLNYEENLETYKLMDFEHIQSLFSSRKFWWWRILKKFGMWKWLTVVLHAGRGLTLAYDQVKRWSKAKVRSKTESKMVKWGGRISDVLCNGKSFSCQCSMTQIGQKETLKKHALRIKKKSYCTHRDFRKVTGRLSGLEKKWSVMVQRTTNLGENRNFLASKMVQNFQERKHPVTTSISALNRGILRKIKGKTDTW